MIHNVFTSLFIIIKFLLKQIRKLKRICREPVLLAAIVMILASLALFVLIYLLLFVLFIYLLDQKIRHGPLADDLVLAYHPKRS